jgi:hypothetical protein
MSVEFEQETVMQNYISSTYAQQGGEKGIIGWLINEDIVKNRNQANIILIILSLIFIALAITLPITQLRQKKVTIYREDLPQRILNNASTEYLSHYPSKN